MSESEILEVVMALEHEGLVELDCMTDKFTEACCPVCMTYADAEAFVSGQLICPNEECPVVEFELNDYKEIEEKFL